MIDVLFFARIREQLGIDKLQISLPEAQMSVSELIAHLVDTHEKHWSDILLADNVVKAVNQQVVDGTQLLHDGDEVAFFPPVTGG